VTALGHLRRRMVAVAQVCYAATRSITKPTLFPCFPWARVSSVRVERAAREPGDRGGEEAHTRSPPLLSCKGKCHLIVGAE